MIKMSQSALEKLDSHFETNGDRHSVKARFPPLFFDFDVYMFSWAWHGLCVFPRLDQVVCFPEYGTGNLVFFKL